MFVCLEFYLSSCLLPERVLGSLQTHTQGTKQASEQGGGVTTTTLRERGLRDHPQTFPIQYHSKGLVALAAGNGLYHGRMCWCWGDLVACSATPRHEGPQSSQQLRAPPANSARRAPRWRARRASTPPRPHGSCTQRGSRSSPRLPGRPRLPSTQWARPSVTSSLSSGTSGVEGHLDLGLGPAACPGLPRLAAMSRAQGAILWPVGRGWARCAPHPPPETFLRHS